MVQQQLNTQGISPSARARVIVLARRTACCNKNTQNAQNEYDWEPSELTSLRFLDAHATRLYQSQSHRVLAKWQYPACVNTHWLKTHGCYCAILRGHRHCEKRASDLPLLDAHPNTHQRY